MTLVSCAAEIYLKVKGVGKVARIGERGKWTDDQKDYPIEDATLFSPFGVETSGGFGPADHDLLKQILAEVPDAQRGFQFSAARERLTIPVHNIARLVYTRLIRAGLESWTRHINDFILRGIK